MPYYRKDWPEIGRPMIHETGSGVLWADILRAEFRRYPQDLPGEHELGCIDAPNSISAGSHIKAQDYPIPRYVFR